VIIKNILSTRNKTHTASTP